MVTGEIKAHMVPRFSENPDERHVEKVYDFYAHDLSVAFELLRKFTDQEGLTASVIAMQKYPTLEHVVKSSKKREADGNLIATDKVVEKKSDTRWVLSFDWKTKDPAEARCLEYDFYDDGWPCKIAFMLADDEPSPVIDLGSLQFPSEDVRRFEMTVSVPDAGRAKRFEEALLEQVGKAGN